MKTRDKSMPVSIRLEGSPRARFVGDPCGSPHEVAHPMGYIMNSSNSSNAVGIG